VKIAVTVDPEIPVPPLYYGGIERIVDLLATELARRGHDVTLFANPASDNACRLMGWPGGSSLSWRDTVRNAAHLGRAVLTERFDVVHSFSRLAYMAPFMPTGVPKVMTYQREISPRTTSWARRLSGRSLHFTAVGRHMVERLPRPEEWTYIPNGVPLDRYDYRSEAPDNAPLVFLGRLEPIKGPDVAVRVARRCGLPLVLAGNIPDAARPFFETKIAPFIDGKVVNYVGPVTDAQKNDILGSARAMLMPIRWEEPFGIVMVEALACGTPVIGFDRGAVREIVSDGATGFVCADEEAMVEAVHRLVGVRREACRADVERRFSSAAIADMYESLYERAVTS
jgi:glycosyltransferase involved in cell wall biosynthesis